MERDGFIMYKSICKPLTGLPDEQLARLFRAIIDYQINGNETTDADIQVYLDICIARFAKDTDSYNQKCSRNAENIRKRWERKHNSVNEESNTTECESIRPNTTEYDRIRMNTNHTDMIGYDRIGNDINIKDTIHKNDFDSNDSSVQKDDSSSKNEFPECQKIVDLFHQHCPSFPKVTKITPDRKNKMRLRFAEMKSDWTTLENVFKGMASSAFLRGDSKSGWKASFDWVFANGSNWIKVIEGNYTDNSQKAQSSHCNSEWGDDFVASKRNSDDEWK